ncbi:hypothetical protein PG994_003521 [Apiospora phragmitis]|uniref:Uncharacterized protein n=1 Tax=Apiospora phragmitis TaxID=2905665 RepID=A0ABR1W270_9PEZI
MDGSDAPEAIDKTANPPELVWNQLLDPEPCVPAYSPQNQQPRQPRQQQYQQQQPNQQYRQHDQQQYQQALPGSQTAYPTASPQSPYGYAVGKSTTAGSGVNGKGVGSKRNATICGISRALFIALVVLTVVIIAAAIGGGVGGSMAVKSAYNDGARGVSSEHPAAEVSASTTNAAAAGTSAASTTASGGSTTGTSTGTSTAGDSYTAPTAGVQLALDCPRADGREGDDQVRQRLRGQLQPGLRPEQARPRLRPLQRHRLHVQRLHAAVRELQPREPHQGLPGCFIWCRYDLIDGPVSIRNTDPMKREQSSYTMGEGDEKMQCLFTNGAR